MREFTEEELRNVLRSTVCCAEELAVCTLLDLVNGELTLDEFKQEIILENQRECYQ